MFSNSLTSLQLSTHTNLHISLDVYKENQCYITVHHSNLKYFQLFIWQSTVMNGFVCFCCSSFAQLCLTLCDPTDYSTPGFPVLHYLPELAQTHVCWVSDVIQPSHPLSSPSPPAFDLSQHQGLFKQVSSSHQVSRVLELQLQHQSYEYSGLIFFRIVWFVLVAVHRTLKSLIQHHNLNASLLRCYFMLQLSDPYMTTGKS